MLIDIKTINVAALTIAPVIDLHVLTYFPWGIRILLGYIIIIMVTHTLCYHYMHNLRSMETVSKLMLILIAITSHDQCGSLIVYVHVRAYRMLMCSEAVYI